MLPPAWLPSATPNNSLRLVASASQLQLLEHRDGKTRVLAETALPPTAAHAVHLRVQDQGGSHYAFAWSTDGRTWQPMLPVNAPADGQFLPPWDQGVRVGVVAQGPASAVATFERFELANRKDR